MKERCVVNRKLLSFCRSFDIRTELFPFIEKEGSDIVAEKYSYEILTKRIPVNVKVKYYSFTDLIKKMKNGYVYTGLIFPYWYGNTST